VIIRDGTYIERSVVQLIRQNTHFKQQAFEMSVEEVYVIQVRPIVQSTVERSEVFLKEC
jgi:hypothetical protein